MREARFAVPVAFLKQSGVVLETMSRESFQGIDRLAQVYRHPDGSRLHLELLPNEHGLRIHRWQTTPPRPRATSFCDTDWA